MGIKKEKDSAWHVGYVKFFDQEKGFGFLRDYAMNEDIFSHQSDLVSERITGGDIVAFRVTPSRRKKGSNKAVQVTILEEHDDSELLSQEFAGKIASHSLHVGRVKFFDSIKGFGFIRDLGSSQDFYLSEENISTTTVNDRDYVVFETQPSKSKRGSEEATEVILLKHYSGQGQVLLDHLGGADGKADELMIKRMDGPALHVLVEQQIEKQVMLDSGPACQKIIRLHDNISKNEVAGDQTRETVCQRVKQTVVRHAGARGRVYFWLKGWCEQPPLDDVAAAMSERWDEESSSGDVSTTLTEEWDLKNARYRILSKFESSERPRLFTTAVRKAAHATDTSSQLDQVRAVLKAAIDWMDHDVVRSMFDDRSRSETQALIVNEKRAKQEQSFYTLGAEAVRTACSEKVQLTLFFEGFLLTYPEAYVKETFSELTREQLTQVFSHCSTKAQLTEELLLRRGANVHERDDVSQIEEVKWIFKSAEAHLTQEATQALQEKVVEDLPAETHLALFFGGHVPTYPPAQVRRREKGEILQELTHEQLEKVLVHPDTGDNFAQEMLRSRLMQKQEDAAAGQDVTREARWILSAAEAHLSEDAADALREQAMHTLPAETRLALFFDGKVPDYPQEHVRKAKPELSLHQLKKVLSHPGTSFNFARELLSKRLASKRDNLSHNGWVREARGMLEAADEHAFIGSALRRYVLHEVPDAAHFALFSQGQTGTFPSEYLRQSAGKVKRHTLEQAVARNVMPSAFVRDVLRDRLEHDLEGDKPLSGVKWILRVGKEHLEEDDAEALSRAVIELLPAEDCLVLWEEGRIDEMPTAHIQQQLAGGEGRIFEKGAQWVQDGRIEPEMLTTLVIDSLTSLPAIKHHNDYARLERRLSLLGATVPRSLQRAKEEVGGEQRDFIRLFSWLNDYDEAFDFEAFSSRVVYLAPNDQVTFLQKLFHLHREGEFVLTAGKLEQLTRVDLDIFSIAEAQGVEETLDLSVEIVIQVVRSVQQDGLFPRQSDLLKIVYHGTTRRDRMKVEDLFDECEGRTGVKWNWNPQYGTITKEANSHFIIEFDYDKDLVEAVKQLPGRRYNPNGKYWTVPSIYEEEVISFARRCRFFINLPDGDHNTNNTHFRDLKRGPKPRGVKFCEGRKYGWSDFVDCGLWDCRGEVCYQNSAPEALRQNWQDYTLRDMLRILGYRFDEKKRSEDQDRPTEVILEGEYFNFVHLLNRFNEILNHLYCRDCGQIIYPIEAGNFGYYRVSNFQCINESCAEHGNEVYLHHCLNGKCKSVIDSRDTVRCPEGWWICTNESCGCCCSHEVNKRRLKNLQRTGGYISRGLKYSVAGETGHLERALHYCYNCGNQMIEYSSEIFTCESCQIKYYTASNKFDRSNR